MGLVDIFGVHFVGPGQAEMFPAVDKAAAAVIFTVLFQKFPFCIILAVKFVAFKAAEYVVDIFETAFDQKIAGRAAAVAAAAHDEQGVVSLEMGFHIAYVVGIQVGLVAAFFHFFTVEKFTFIDEFIA